MRRIILVCTVLLFAALPVAAREWSIGLLSLANDERYSAQALEKAYPDKPNGRALIAVQLALDDAAYSLQAAGISKSRVVAVQATDAADLLPALERLLGQGVHHIVLELPAAAVTQVAAKTRGKDVMLVNAAAPEDSLRAESCAPQLLHSLPSQAMQADALAQFLVAHKWTKPLLLYGTSEQDPLLVAAFTRSAKRFGVKPVAQRPFKMSNDPRERDSGNVRLLTANADYDAVVVLDALGEFARDLPYRPLLPRPVLGSNGLTAQAWSMWYERNGAPQLNRRFFKRSGRAMGSYDWAAWVATRAMVETIGADTKTSVAQQIQALKQGSISVDGYKGQSLTFRAWDGQLRQPLLLAHGNGLSDIAPLEGFLHPRNALDSLGFDLAETGCKTP